MRFNLFKLHVSSDRTPKSWICARGNRLKEELRRLIDEITKGTGLSKSSIFREIIKELKCPFSNIKRRIYRKSTFPLIMILKLLELWKVRLNKSEKEFIDEREKIQEAFEYLKGNSSPSRPVKAVKSLSVNLAKICGAHAADGWMDARKRENGFIAYDYALREEDKRTVLAFQKWIFDEFNLVTKINNRISGCYSIEFSNKILVRYLHIFFGFPYGKKTYTVKEPGIIKKSNLVFRKAFALGVMNFDGGVCKSNRIELLICSKPLRDSVFEIITLGGIHNVTLTNHPDKFKRWHFYSSRSIKNQDFIKWLDYFERDTNKYNRVLAIIKRM